MCIDIHNICNYLTKISKEWGHEFEKEKEEYMVGLVGRNWNQEWYSYNLIK